MRTGASGGSVALSPIVEYANRGIPVLLLDPVPRPALKVKLDPADLSTRDALITAAIAASAARHQELWACGRVDQFDNQNLAFFIDVLEDDGKLETSFPLQADTDSSQTLYAAIKNAEMASKNSRSFMPAQLERVVNHMIEMLGQSHIRCLNEKIRTKQFPAAARWDTKSPEMEQVGFDPMEEWSERLGKIHSVYTDIFKSEQIFGANRVDNLESVKGLIDGIVKRNRLPSDNSFEAKQLLHSAWNHVDVCTHNAAKYKVIEKVSYALQLLLTAVVSALTVYRGTIDEELSASKPSAHMDQSRASSATKLTRRRPSSSLRHRCSRS